MKSEEKEVMMMTESQSEKRNFHFDKRPPSYYYTFICIAFTVFVCRHCHCADQKREKEREKLESYVKN